NGRPRAWREWRSLTSAGSLKNSLSVIREPWHRRRSHASAASPDCCQPCRVPCSELQEGSRHDKTLQLVFSSRRRHTRFDCDWSSDVCSSDLFTKTSARKFASSSWLAFIYSVSPK